MTPSRRRFLRLGLAAGGAVALRPRGAAALAPLGGRPTPAGPSGPHGAPWFRISLAEWSLHQTLYSGEITHLDFPTTARALDIDAVEYVNSFFKDKAKDFGYLGELKRRCDQQGVRSLLIMCDGEGRIGDPDAGMRTRAIENHHRWVEAAKFLGCHSIRVNAASQGPREEQARLAADGLRRLTEFAAGHDLNVLVENHGGWSSHGEWLAGVMRLVDHPRCGTLPDFGNFHVHDGEWYDRYQGVKELMPFAKAVSAKSHAFDEEGNETGTDYRRMLAIVRDAGYRGWIGVEWEGPGISEREGIRRTRDLLRRVRAELAPAAGETR